jgi:hypothetical protein
MFPYTQYIYGIPALTCFGLELLQFSYIRSVFPFARQHVG